MYKISINKKLILSCVILGVFFLYLFTQNIRADQTNIKKQIDVSSANAKIINNSMSERCAKPISEEMDTTTICKYASASIEKVYYHMLKKHVGLGTASALKSIFPAKNTKYED